MSIAQGERDARGRFVAGNSIASLGGHARARALSPRRRSSIARRGWKAMVKKHFAGDKRAAKARWAAIGLWNSERVFEGTPVPVRARYPGTVQEFRARYYQLDLMRGTHLDVDFYGREV